MNNLNDEIITLKDRSYYAPEPFLLLDGMPSLAMFDADVQLQSLLRFESRSTNLLGVLRLTHSHTFVLFIALARPTMRLMLTGRSYPHHNRRC